MTKFSDRWKNLSIAKRLYVVVGVMATLIAAELATLSFAMNTLSAVRAFVVGEGLWSKAQKNSIFRLERFARTRDEQDYQAYLAYLEIPEGDRRARLELEKPNPDMTVVRAGFIQGQIHPDDIDPMVNLIRRFSWVSFLRRAIEVWTEGDRLVAELKEVGEEYRGLILAANPDRARLRSVETKIGALNRQLTSVEAEFSDVLGQGSRWLERMVISLLFLAVLLVEAVGLTITIRTGRQISRELAEVSATAEAIGHGEHDRRVKIHSGDEIGKLAASVNVMGEMIQASHGDLERRVRERTLELEKAIRARDEFVSIVSHELNTPLSAMKLQIQLREKVLAKEESAAPFSRDKILSMLQADSRQLDRLVRLVREMLDVSRLSAGRFTLSTEAVNLGDLVLDVIGRFSGNLAATGIVLETEIEPDVVGEWDLFRVDQIFTNLLTNAMKYGRNRPILVRVARSGDRAILAVKDRGLGIAPEDQARIFWQFERAITAEQISGLGLGLFIVKELVEAHSGTIVVRSDLGEGSEFIVELPLKRES